MNNIHIRPATQQDVPTLSEVAALTFRATYGKYSSSTDVELYIAQNFSLEAIQKALVSSQNFFLLAFHGQHLLGYAKLVRNVTPDESLPAKELVQLEKIYLLPEAQGKKVGYQLMQTCIDVAQQEGFKSLWLGVWKQNKHAIAFYEKIGFKVAGNYAFAMGNTVYEEDYWMLKKIS